MAGSLRRREKTAWRQRRALLTSGGRRDRKDWERPTRDTYVGSRPVDMVAAVSGTNWTKGDASESLRAGKESGFSAG